MKPFIPPKQQLLILHSNIKSGVSNQYGGDSRDLLQKLPPINNGDYLQSFDDQRERFTFTENAYNMSPGIYTLSKCGSYNCAFTVSYAGNKYALRMSYPQITTNSEYTDLQFNDKAYHTYKNMYGSYIPDINYYGLIIFKSKIKNNQENKRYRYLSIPKFNAKYGTDLNKSQLNKLYNDYGDYYDVCYYTIGRIYITDFSRIVETKNKYQIIISLLNGLLTASKNGAFYDDLKLLNLGYYLTNEGKYEICFIDTDETTWVPIDKKNSFTATYFPMWYPNRDLIYNPRDRDLVNKIKNLHYAGGFAMILAELFFDNSIVNLLHAYLYHSPSKVNNQSNMKELHSVIQNSLYTKLYPDVANILIYETAPNIYYGILSSFWYYTPTINNLLDSFTQLLAALDDPQTLEAIIRRYREAILKNQEKITSIHTENSILEASLKYITQLIDIATRDKQYAEKEIKARLAQPGALQRALGAQPGALPGALPGAQPGAQPGALPGALPGAQPGAQPGALPGAQPGALQRALWALPGAQPGVLDAQQPNVPPVELIEQQRRELNQRRLEFYKRNGIKPPDNLLNH